MVFINTMENPLLSDVRRTLIEMISHTKSTSLEAAFVAWVCPLIKPSINAELPDTFSMMDYRHVAQLGLLTFMDPIAYKNHQDDLTSGLRRIIGRPTTMIGGSTAPFTTDVIALIGLAIGARHVGGKIKSETADWMTHFVQETCKNLPLWKRCLAFGALQLVESSNPITLSITGNAAAIRIALDQAGISQIRQDQDGDNTLVNLCRDVIEDEEKDPCLAGLRLGALHYIIDSAPTLSLSEPTLHDLIRLLERIPAAFRRWTWEEKAKTTTSTLQQWDIQNEYHVQNLLYLLLSPIFPDLEDEFYFDPVGQKNARADLGIPSMQLIIEVKFVRNTVRFANMIEEVAADNSLYFGQNRDYTSRYQHLLVFIWDDSCRTHEHDVFKRGINQLSNVVGSVVISRPGNMPQRT